MTTSYSEPAGIDIDSVEDAAAGEPSNVGGDGSAEVASAHASLSTLSVSVPAVPVAPLSLPALSLSVPALPAPEAPGAGTTLTGVALAASMGAAASTGAAATFPVAVDSNPRPAEFLRHINRSLRTAAPLLLADGAALVAAAAAAQALLAVLGWRLPPEPVPAALWLLPMVAGYWLLGLYSEVWVHPAVELRQATRATTLALLAAALAGWRTPPVPAWCAAAWPAAVVLVPLARSLARRCCAGRAWWGFPTLVIGSGTAADRLARLLMRTRSCGLRPVLLTDPGGACRASIVPVMNDPSVLRSIVRVKGIRHAVLAAPAAPAAGWSHAFDEYGALASHLLVVCDAPPIPALWGLQRVCGLGGLEVRNGLLLAPCRAAKGAMDAAVAGAVLVLGLPLLLAIALAVKLTSRGPVLFGHTRIGRYGRKFTAWKFRTMRRDADLLLDRHLERFPEARVEWERDQKLRDDPRVTRVGRVLRRLSLDELPQVWNVLRGEMSVVGPRPIVDDEVCKYGEAFGLYTVVKPGITGLWQVSGRTDVGYDLRVKLDEFYVRHWSPWLDAYVLVRTVVALVRRKGAY